MVTAPRLQSNLFWPLTEELPGEAGLAHSGDRPESSGPGKHGHNPQELLDPHSFPPSCAGVPMLSCSVTPNSETPGGQVPLSTGFSRPEHWNGSPLPPPGDRTWVSCISGVSRWVLYYWAIWRALLPSHRRRMWVAIIQPNAIFSFCLRKPRPGTSTSPKVRGKIEKPGLLILWVRWTSFSSMTVAITTWELWTLS